jgi:hypothetical protein
MARCAAGPDGCAVGMTLAVENGRCSGCCGRKLGDKDATEATGAAEAALAAPKVAELGGVAAHGGGTRAPAAELVAGNAV